MSLPIIFRTSGGEQTGFGHVRRCLTLAGELTGLGAGCTFVLDGAVAAVEHVAALGYAVRHITTGEDPAATLAEANLRGARAIVTDSYAFQTTYFEALATTRVLIVAIDDLADRALPADVVINSSVRTERSAYFGGRTSTLYLLGLDYVLLRPEFRRRQFREVAEQVSRVLVTVGGSDPRGLTPRVSAWTLATLPGVRVDVNVGPLFDEGNSLEGLGREHAPRLVVHRSPPGIGDLMLAADLAICGGGQTIFELAATATPALAIEVADNQAGNLAAFEAAGTLVRAGHARDADLESRFTHRLAQVAADRRWRSSMAECGYALVDGRGALRVAQAIMELARNART